MRISVSAICDIGLVRSSNEDMILVDDKLLRDGRYSAEIINKNDKPFVLAVADGMGGLENGEEASAMVLERLLYFMHGIPGDLSDDEIAEVFRTFAEETHMEVPKNSGSTLVGILFYRGKAFRFHAGDSRLWLFSHGLLKRLTMDHSLRESGSMPDAPSNIITNSFGGGGKMFLEFTPIDVGLSSTDIILLSSDGLHDIVHTDEIEDILKTNPCPLEALVSAAESGGGKDNISVIIASIQEV